MIEGAILAGARQLHESRPLPPRHEEGPIDATHAGISKMHDAQTLHQVAVDAATNRQCSVA
jgi:hypothetical protein